MYTSHADLLQVEAVRDGLLVRLHGPSLDRTNAYGLAEELFDLAFHRGGPTLYLDCTEIEELEESILLRLVLLSWKLQSMGDRLVLRNLRPQVYEALQASRLLDHLVIC